MKKNLLIILFALIWTLSCKTTLNEIGHAPKENQMESLDQKPKSVVGKWEEFYFTNVNNGQEIIKLRYSKENHEILEANFIGMGSDYPIQIANAEFSNEFGLMGIATSKAWNGEAIVGLDPEAQTFTWNDGKTKKKFKP